MRQRGLLIPDSSSRLNGLILFVALYLYFSKFDTEKLFARCNTCNSRWKRATISLIWPWCTHDVPRGLMEIQQSIHQQKSSAYNKSVRCWEHISQVHLLHHTVLASAISTWGTPLNPRASAASPALHKGVASAAAEALCLGAEASRWYW